MELKSLCKVGTSVAEETAFATEVKIALMVDPIPPVEMFQLPWSDRNKLTPRKAFALALSESSCGSTLDLE